MGYFEWLYGLDYVLLDFPVLFTLPTLCFTYSAANLFDKSESC